ncbi:MAG TPA: GspH/FimT family protein, partial [Gammaproteobacteria bacterium]|nr:GspH/FimT family protein [Gammaproteobacteria bacterium]
VTAAMSVVRAFNFARTRSIMTNRYIEICKSADGAQCSDDAATWSDGWIVFANEDRDWDVDPGEQILLRHGPVADGIQLTANRDGFNFRPQSIRSTTGSVFVCAGSQAVGEAVIVSYTGRVRTSMEKADGTVVDCN